MILPGVIASSGGVASSYQSISTVTVGSGGSSSISFSSIPNTFAHLQIRMTTLASTAANVLLQFNGDTANNYWWHELWGEGTTAYSTNSGAAVSNIKTGYTNTTTPYTGGSVVDVLDYCNTNKYKTVRALTGSDNNGAGYVLLRSGVWNSTSSITSFILYPVSGTFTQYSHFALYGVKA
jgi:hypothetical protein